VPLIAPLNQHNTVVPALLILRGTWLIVLARIEVQRPSGVDQL
jgi:hypothetical protein